MFSCVCTLIDRCVDGEEHSRHLVVGWMDRWMAAGRWQSTSMHSAARDERLRSIGEGGPDWTLVVVVFVVVGCFVAALYFIYSIRKYFTKIYGHVDSLRFCETRKSDVRRENLCVTN